MSLSVDLGGVALGRVAFAVQQLFTLGTSVGGAHWFDSPSLYPGGNHLYLYQDNAGTTPVTAVGDTIGLSLDRAYGGYRGPDLVTNGGFDSNLTGWTNSGDHWTWSSSGATMPLTSTYLPLEQTLSLTTGKTYEITFSVSAVTDTMRCFVRNPGVTSTTVLAVTTTGNKRCVFTANETERSVGFSRNSAAASITIDNVSVREIPGTHLIQATGTARPTLSARVNMLLNTATMSTQNVTTIAASYRLRFDGTGTVTLSGTATAGPLSAGTHSVTATAGTLTLTVSGSVTSADFRTADDAAKNIPAYQRVGATAADHDTDGFPHYALFDGTDDSWASTATVDGSGSDKVTLVAGVTKNSDAAAGVVIETTTSWSGNAGTLILSASGAGASWGFGVRGSTGAGLDPTGYPAPATAVLTGIGDIPADDVRLFVNAQLAASSTSDRGTGNFANATLYVGSRAGTSLRFNGRLYSLVPRFGAMGEADRNRLEQWNKNLMRLP